MEKLKRAIELCQVFGTPNIRIFSYYPPQKGGDWAPWRQEILNRLAEECRLAAQAGVRLIHENEHRIYGDSPERVQDLMTSLLAQFSSSTIGGELIAANVDHCWQ